MSLTYFLFIKGWCIVVCAVSEAQLLLICPSLAGLLSSMGKMYYLQLEEVSVLRVLIIGQ